MTTLIIAQLTFRETQRRRILWIALLMGALFLLLNGIGFYNVYQELQTAVDLPPTQARAISGVLLSAGLYVVNFLIIMLTVLTSVTAISSEIDTHTIETVLTKPLARWEVVLGKWLGFAMLLVLYVFMLAGGVILIAYFIAGVEVETPLRGLSLMVLEGLIVLSLTIAGGTRLSTLANGVLAFMLYGVAFIGGWVEQIGALLENETAVNIGIISSLLMPSEILWKRALALFQPAIATNPLLAGPFAVVTRPSELMIWYALGYMLALLLFALVAFTRRDL